MDIEEEALQAAQAELQTSTIKDTVNQALRRAAERRRATVAKSLQTLAKAQLANRSEAWR